MNRNDSSARQGGNLSGRIAAARPDPSRPRHVLTVDDTGVVRSGPAGAWWSNLRPRLTNAAGLTLELPSGRARAWNVAGVLVMAAGVVWAKVSTGWPWTSLLAGVVLVLGVAGAALLRFAYWWAARQAARSASDAARFRAEADARAARAALVELERRTAAAAPAASPAPVVARLSESAVCESCRRRPAALLVILGPDAAGFAVCSGCAAAGVPSSPAPALSVQPPDPYRVSLDAGPGGRALVHRWLPEPPARRGGGAA
jgi:hypothetical protein